MLLLNSLHRVRHWMAIDVSISSQIMTAVMARRTFYVRLQQSTLR